MLELNEEFQSSEEKNLLMLKKKICVQHLPFVDEKKIVYNHKTTNS